MTAVVGVEGVVKPDAIVIWGAAAVSAPDGWIINSHSGAKASPEEARRLHKEEQLFLFDNAIEIRDEHATEALVVLMVNRLARQREAFLVETGRMAGITGHTHTARWFISVFANRAAFDLYAATVADRIATQVLYSEKPKSEENNHLVRLGLVVSPGNPTLNALRVFLSGSEGGAIHRLARAAIRPRSAVDRFELLLTAMRSQNDDYELKYEGGIAKEGGFDVDVAAATLDAIEKAHKALVPVIKQSYGFIREVPAPRFHHMRAASAELHFVPAVKGRPLGERVARYMTLVLLQRTLRGESIPEVPRPLELQAAVNRIANPGPDTRVMQKPLSRDDREDVNPAVGVGVQADRSQELQVLGYVSGLQRDFRIELSLGKALRLNVSTTDDGTGQGRAPRGAEATAGHGDEFLRKPSVFSIVRDLSAGGSTGFHLREMRLLVEDRSETVTAIPSTIVSGAFLIGIRLDVRLRADGVLETPLGQWPRASAGTLADARHWLIEYTTAAFGHEIGQAPPIGRWLRASEPPVPSALQRVLVALARLGGKAPIPDLLVEIRRRFGVQVRTNNTRREVLRNPTLLAFDPDDDSVMRWTDAGQAYYRIYVAAGGQSRRES